MKEMKKYTAKKLRLVDRFFDLVVTKKKISTIRYGLVFFEDIALPLESNKSNITVEITKIDYSKTYIDLTDEDAKNDGFMNLNELKDELNKFYKNLVDTDRITIIYFKLPD